MYEHSWGPGLRPRTLHSVSQLQRRAQMFMTTDTVSGIPVHTKSRAGLGKAVWLPRPLAWHYRDHPSRASSLLKAAQTWLEGRLDPGGGSWGNMQQG